jgi:hypothetical protein
MQTHLTCHLYSAKILKKYSTKQNSTWTIEGVTYWITNARNLSSKDGLSKEIKNWEQEQQEHGFELWSEDISGEKVKWLVER